MSKYDSYGGVGYDRAFDGGDVYDWAPASSVNDENLVWEIPFGDPTGWETAVVTAKVWEVAVPPHDNEGNALNEPWLIPEAYIGQTEVLVAGCLWDWEHSTGDILEACPPSYNLEQAQANACALCEGPVSASGTVLVKEGSAWLPGNPEFIFDDSDPENLVVYLRYWRPMALEPYDSEAIGFTDNPANAIERYAASMGWLESPPNV